jgi:hypothetical protein
LSLLAGEKLRKREELSGNKTRIALRRRRGEQNWPEFDGKRCSIVEIVSIEDELGSDGHVMEVLSEHLCQGWLEGCLLTGRHGVLSSYEAFAQVVDSMTTQHAKWLEKCREYSHPEDGGMAMTILIVDDAATMLMILKTGLASSGSRVQSANSGQAALDKLKSGIKPGLILTGINMPGMAGLELIGKTRSLCLSLYSDPNADHRRRNLQKPGRQATWCN